MLMLALSNVSPVESSAVTVATSTNNMAEYCYQRHTFRATNGYHFDFYDNNSYSIAYKSSANGVTFGSATKVRTDYGGDYFSIDYPGSGSYVYLAHAYINSTLATVLEYVRGTISSGTITWGTWYKAIETANNAGTEIEVPVVKLDSALKPYIAYVMTITSVGDYAYVIQGSNSDGSGSWTDTGLGGGTYTTTNIDLVALTATKMFVFYGASTGDAWNGASWLTPKTITYTYGYTSMVNSSDNVYLTICNGTSPYGIYCYKYTYSTNSWGSKESVCPSNSAKYYPELSIDSSTGYLYCFIENCTSNYVYYVKRTTLWGSKTAWLNEASDGIWGGLGATNTYLCSSYLTYGYTIGISYMTKTSSPYNIRYAFLSTSVCSIGQFQASSTVYANTYVNVNATVNSQQNKTNLVNATVQLTGSVMLKWVNSTNTFSIASDANHYVMLKSSSCSRTTLNTTAYRLSWNLKFGWNYTEGSISVTSATVFDTLSSNTNSQTGLFTFEHKLAINTASVNQKRVNIGTSATFSGQIYCYGTSTVPTNTTGITGRIENITHTLKGSSATINSTGFFTVSFNQPNTAGNYSYNVYASTTQADGVNKTVYCSSDRITFTVSLAVEKSRINNGTNGVWYCTLKFESDSKTLTNGTISLNTGTMTYNGTYYRYSFSTTSVTIATRNIVSVSGMPYNITTLNTAVTGASASVIYDCIAVSGKGVAIARLDINKYSQYWFKLRSLYDNSPVQTGTVTLNGTVTATWISARSRWEYNTTKSLVQKKSLYVASLSWPAYSITSLALQTANYTSIIWDRITVAITPSTTSPTVGATVTFTVKATYAYDSGQVSPLTVNIFRNSTHYASGNFSDTETTVKLYIFTGENASETTYGLSAFVSNDVTVYWSGGSYVVLTVRTVDLDSNIIAGATVYINNGTQYQFTSDSNGLASLSRIVGGTSVSVKVKWEGCWVNGTWATTMSSTKTIDAKCNVWSFTINARDNGGVGLSLSSTNVVWKWPNGTTSNVTRSDGSLTMRVMNGTSYYRIQYQGQWVSVNYTLPMTGRNVTIVNRNCWVYSLTVYVQTSSDSLDPYTPIPGATVTLFRGSDNKTLNGYYGLPSSPATSSYNSTFAEYVWTQLANQTGTQYTVTANINNAGSPESASTFLAANSAVGIRLVYPVGGGSPIGGGSPVQNPAANSTLPPVFQPVVGQALPASVSETLPWVTIGVVVGIIAIPVAVNEELKRSRRSRFNPYSQKHTKAVEPKRKKSKINYERKRLFKPRKIERRN